MLFVPFIFLAMACGHSVDPKVDGAAVDPKIEEAVVALEKFSAEAKAGDCAALKTASDAAHAAEGLKGVVAGSPLEARVKAAEDKVKPLLDACAAPAAVPVAPASEDVPAPAAPPIDPNH